MRRAFESMRRAARVGVALACGMPLTAFTATCDKPLYLTFDTGHMGIAPLVADVLKRHAVKVTFFLANERTQTGGTSLDAQWEPWWTQRALEGHAFASHTWDHAVWRADRADGFVLQPTAGAQTGKRGTYTHAQYCEQIKRPAQWFKALTGKDTLPLYRAPGGKTSEALVASARQCGFEHVGWSAAGFLGDELPSDRYPNDQLLARALRDLRSNDILLAHLGIWSRQDPWAPAVLEPLIIGLKQRGFCFATLAEHPGYGRGKR